MVEQIPTTIPTVFKSVEEVNSFLASLGVRARISLREFSSLAREGGRMRNKKADVASSMMQYMRVSPYVFFQFCGNDKCIWYPDPSYFARDVGVVMVVEVDCTNPQKARAVFETLVELYGIPPLPGTDVAFQNICGVVLYEPPEPAPPPPTTEARPAKQKLHVVDKQKAQELADKLVQLANALEVQPEEIADVLLKKPSEGKGVEKEAELGRAIMYIYGDDGEKLTKSDYIDVVRAVLGDEDVLKVVRRMLTSEAYRKVVKDLLEVPDEKLAEL